MAGKQPGTDGDVLLAYSDVGRGLLVYTDPSGFDLDDVTGTGQRPVGVILGRSEVGLYYENHKGPVAGGGGFALTTCRAGGDGYESALIF